MALGRLDGGEVRGAESLLSSCADCRSWWNREIEGDSFPVVDQAVADAVREFEPPRRAVRGPWATWAAAAVLAVAVGVVLQMGQDPVETSTPASRMGSVETDMDRLLTEGFEEGIDFEGAEGMTWVGLLGQETTANLVLGDQPASAETIFADGMEAGELISWSDNS